jgi:hypothetical protein
MPYIPGAYDHVLHTQALITLGSQEPFQASVKISEGLLTHVVP